MLALGVYSLVAYLRPRWLWVLPVPAEAAFGVFVWRAVASVMAFGFALTCTLAFAERHPRRWALTFASSAMLFVVTAWVSTRTSPIADRLSVEERDGVVLQSSDATCVSASAANLLRLHGRHTTEPEMAELLGATSAGATSAQLLDGLEATGLACERAFYPERKLTKVTAPAVLFYGEAYGVPHAVVLESRDDDRVAILDPLRGRSSIPLEKVEAWWDGEAVTCGVPM